MPEKKMELVRTKDGEQYVRARTSAGKRDASRRSTSDSNHRSTEIPAPQSKKTKEIDDVIKALAIDNPDRKTQAFANLAIDNPGKIFTHKDTIKEVTPSGEEIYVNRTRTFSADTSPEPMNHAHRSPERSFTAPQMPRRTIDVEPEQPPRMRSHEPERFPEPRRVSTKPERSTRSRQNPDFEHPTSPGQYDDFKRTTSPEGYDDTASRMPSRPSRRDSKHATYPEPKSDSLTDFLKREDGTPRVVDPERPRRPPVETTVPRPSSERTTNAEPSLRSSFLKREDGAPRIVDPAEDTTSRTFPKPDKGTKSYPLPNLFKREDGTSRRRDPERPGKTPDPVENTTPRTFPEQAKDTRSSPLPDLLTGARGQPRTIIERSRKTDPVDAAPSTPPEPQQQNTQPRRHDTAPPKTDARPKSNGTEFPKDAQPKRNNTQSGRYTEAGRSASERGFVPDEADKKPAVVNTEQTVYSAKAISMLSDRQKKDLMKNPGPEELGSLGSKHVEALGETILKQLSPEEVKGIAKGLGPHGIGALDSYAINDLGPNLIEGLGPENSKTLVRMLDPQRLGIVENNRLRRLNNEVIKKLAQELGSEMIEDLGAGLVHRMEPDMVKGLGSAGAKKVATGIGPRGIDMLNRETTKQLAHEIGRDMVKHLGPNLAYMMDTDTIKGLGSNGATKVAKDLGPRGIEDLHPKVVQQLAHEIGTTKAAEILRLPEGLGDLGTEIIGKLTAADAKAVIEGLGPINIAKLNADARSDLINKITPEALRDLIKTLGNNEIKKLGHAWLRTLGPHVVKEVDAAFPNLLQEISDAEEQKNPQHRRFMEAKREEEKRKAQRQQSNNRSYPQGYNTFYRDNYEEFYRTYRAERAHHP